jgi:uncharacterized protein DUF6064
LGEGTAQEASLLELPFSRDQFLDVFEAYNRALVAPAAGMWLFALAVTISIVRGRDVTRWAFAVQALLWAWSGVAYHAVFFARVNPAARLFAGLFVVQAAAFAWLATIEAAPRVAWRRDVRHAVALSVATYGLAYPFVAAVAGSYPRTPTFGVPCPTTIFTIGLLLATNPLPRWLVIIPLMWSVVGGSAALVLDMPADAVLLLGGAVLAIYAFIPSARRPRAA